MLLIIGAVGVLAPLVGALVLAPLIATLGIPGPVWPILAGVVIAEVLALAAILLVVRLSKR